MPEFRLTRSGNSSDTGEAMKSFTTMTAAIKTWGAHSEPPKHRIETAAPIILQVAPTMTTGDTAAQLRSTAAVVR